jgi:predicted enzyme related to lactoylglutathione lyase
MSRFGHIDLRVLDLASSLPFYSQLLPALGFTRERHGQSSCSFSVESGSPEDSYVAIIADPHHVPNATRIAFWAEGREEVDRIAAVVRAAGGQHIEGPELCPYSRIYYALFFEDPSGNRFEVYFRQD